MITRQFKVFSPYSETLCQADKGRSNVICTFPERKYLFPSFANIIEYAFTFVCSEYKFAYCLNTIYEVLSAKGLRPKLKNVISEIATCYKYVVQVVGNICPEFTGLVIVAKYQFPRLRPTSCNSFFGIVECFCKCLRLLSSSKSASAKIVLLGAKFYDHLTDKFCIFASNS